jgi:hypothetical protein
MALWLINEALGQLNLFLDLEHSWRLHVYFTTGPYNSRVNRKNIPKRLKPKFASKVPGCPLHQTT